MSSGVSSPRTRRTVFSELPVGKLHGTAWTLALAIVGVACGPRATGDLHRAVVCDVSTSGAELSCSKASVHQVGKDWIDSVGRYASGRLELYLMGNGVDDTPRLMSVEYPRRFAPPVTQSKRRWRDSVLTAIDSVAAALPTGRGSAVAEAVFRATRGMAVGTTRTNELWLLADLRQVSPGVWNFERHVPQDMEFLEWIRLNGLEPRTGVLSRITVCGFHLMTPYNTGRITALSYNRLEELWTRIFRRWTNDVRIAEACVG